MLVLVARVVLVVVAGFVDGLELIGEVALFTAGLGVGFFRLTSIMGLNGLCQYLCGGARWRRGIYVQDVVLFFGCV